MPPYVIWPPLYLGYGLLRGTLPPLLLSYDGSNQAVQCLQMRITGWDVDIMHRTNNCLANADYWSKLNADLCYDPTFKDYIWLVTTLRSQLLSPTELPMQPRNMPYYYRGPHIKHPVEPCPEDIEHQQSLAISVLNCSHIGSVVSICPVQFGNFENPILVVPDESHNYNDEFPAFALSVTRDHWAIYSFNSGHFASSIATRNLLFNVVLACDPFAFERALFAEFTKCPCILSSANALFDHIRGSGDQSPIDGYMIHLHRFQSSEPTTTFWLLQTLIITQLQAIRLLFLFVVFVHPDHNGRSVSRFVSDLSKTGWVTSSTKLDFNSFGDLVVGTVTMINGVHNSTESTVDKFHLQTPPSTPPLRLNSFLWRNFNKAKYGILFGRNKNNFGKEPYVCFMATLPSSSTSASLADEVKQLYFLHHSDADNSILVGVMVVSWDSLCLPITSTPNNNLFQSHFGIEFVTEDLLSTHRAFASWAAFIITFLIAITGMCWMQAFRH
jgi:hypothetical protein